MLLTDQPAIAGSADDGRAGQAASEMPSQVWQGQGITTTREQLHQQSLAALNLVLSEKSIEAVAISQQVVPSVDHGQSSNSAKTPNFILLSEKSLTHQSCR